MPGLALAMRGTEISKYVAKSSPGSLPPMRGTRKAVVKSVPVVRITPAYAGNTILLSCDTWLCEDHPRLRGEHLIFLLTVDSDVGSPPPTRGTLNLPTHCRFRRRITPAYAGNTIYAMESVRYGQDHPRLRGEHHFYYSSISSLIGSPPPTRGTLLCGVAKVADGRITPAYAGNTMQGRF